MSNIGDNSVVDKSAALKDAYDMGKREGGGAAARAAFYTTLVQWAKEKRIDVSNSEEMWDNFDKGAAAGAAMVGGLKASAKPEETRKVRVSETRQFIKMGGNPYIDGCEVMDRAMAIIKKARLEGRVKSKPTDCMLNVARAQNKDEQNPLDDDTIEAVIQPESTPDKIEADMLARVIIELDRTMKKHGESDDVLSARACVEQRIQALGGTTKSRKAAAAIAAKKGSGRK